MPARSRILAAACAATAATAALTACNSDSSRESSAPLLAPAATTSAKAEPFADLTAQGVADRAESNMRDSGAMTVNVTGADDGVSVQIKSAVTTTGKCALAMRIDDRNVQVVSPGDGHGYIKADAGFWRASGGSKGGALADTVAGRWVSLTRTQFDSSPFGDLCSFDGLMDSLITDDDTLTKGEPTTLDGEPVVTLSAEMSEETDTLYVSTGATPYVVKVESTDTESPGNVTFGDFGKAPHVTAPPRSQTVDIGSLGLDPDRLSV